MIHIFKGIKINNIRACLQNHRPVGVPAAMDTDQDVGVFSQVIDDNAKHINDLMALYRGKGRAKP